VSIFSPITYNQTAAVIGYAEFRHQPAGAQQCTPHWLGGTSQAPQTSL